MYLKNKEYLFSSTHNEFFRIDGIDFQILHNL